MLSDFLANAKFFSRRSLISEDVVVFNINPGESSIVLKPSSKGRGRFFRATTAFTLSFLVKVNENPPDFLFLDEFESKFPLKNNFKKKLKEVQLNI